MKKFLLATVALVALVGIAAPASAADMAVKAAPLPYVAPMYNWSGFYIGANGGWGQSHSCVDFLNAVGVAFAQGCASRSGGLFGGQLGYRWQASQWVFGLEAQGDWADLSNQRSQHLQSCVLYSHQNRWHRPFHRPDRLCMERLAVLLQGRRGGDRATALASSIPPLALNWPRQARPAGVAPWVLDGSMASHRIGPPVLNTITCLWATRIIRSRLPIRVLSVSLNDRISQDVDMLTLRVNYRFGWGSPVVAKY